jgi:C-terminal processing protease CtpA/Prc
MVAGLRSLFNEGIVSESYTYEFGDKNGSPVFFRNDSLVTDFYKIKLNRFANHSRLPVAVLIGPSTASAGECTAAALTYRKKTVLIGEESMGLTNGNDGFQLLPDIGFNLAVGVLKNGKGQRLNEAVAPDIVVAGGDNFTSLTEDRKVQRAIRWIYQQKK